KRVGIRAYTVTTATWVRGLLASDYGVDLDSIEWITFEDPHVAEYRDPAFVKRAPAGKELAQMLLDGEIDAVVVGDKLPDPRLEHLIPDHEAAARASADGTAGRRATAASRSTTWRWCARACRGSARTWCASCFAACTRASAPRACRTAGRSIPIASASPPAGRSSRSSSTSAGASSCCRGGSR